MPLSVIARPLPEVTIAVPRAKYHAVVKELVECGCLHPLRGEGDLAAAARRLRGEVELMLSRISDAIRRIGESAETQTVLRVETRIDEVVRKTIENISGMVESVEKILTRLSDLTSPTSEIAKLMELLRLYGKFLDVDLERIGKGKWIRAKIFRVETEKADFLKKISERGPFLVVALEGVEKKNLLVAIIYPASYENDVAKYLREVRAQVLEIPSGYSPIPVKALEELLREVERLPQEARKHLPALSEAARKLQALLEILRIVEATTTTHYIAFIRGYLDRSKTASLLERLRRVCGQSFAVYTRTKLHVHGHGEKLPTEFRYPGFLKPIADLIETYGHPGPLEIVPLALTAITLPIIFGLMFPDLGHGLVLFLAGLYLYRRTAMKSLGMLAVYLGVSAMFFGFLSGEFFGADPRLAGWLTSFWENVAHMAPPYESPVHPLVGLVLGGEAELELVGVLVMRTIFLALTLGSALLALAAWLGVIGAVIRRERLELVESLGRALAFTGVLTIFAGAMLVGGGLSGYTSLGVILAKASFLPIAGLEASPSEALLALIADVLVIGGLLLMFMAPVVFEKEEAIGMRIISGFIELFDLLLLVIGNTASFVRIMGLMLAHSGLMFGFLILAVSAGNIVAWAIVYALGNILVLGLEALIASAHTLRLHFYEMYSKFYRGEGLVFTPAIVPPGVRLEAV